MKRTGLLAAGIAVLIAACGPRPADVSIDDVDLPTTTTVKAVPDGEVTSERLPAESDITEPEPEGGQAVTESRSLASTTTTSAVANRSSSPVTTTTTTTAPVEIVLPDLSELDQLVVDVDSLVDDIDLTQTEGDLP